jgi:hypothetical protein
MPAAPGGPRSPDWIDETGIAALYFVDIANFRCRLRHRAARPRLGAPRDGDKRLEELMQRFGSFA